MKQAKPANKLQVSVKHTIVELEARFLELRQQAEELLAARSAMLARERLLSAWCSGFQIFSDLGCTSGSLDEQEWHRLQQLKLELSKQLTQIPCMDDSIELLPGPNAGLYSTIAPAADPMAYLRHLVSMPVLPAAATMSNHELVCLLREATMQAGLHQHQLQMTPPSLQEPIILKMQQVWDRYYHAVLSLRVVGRPKMYPVAALYNLETMQPDPEGAMQHEKALHERIPFLQLTPKQQEAIAVGMAMYDARMRSIFDTIRPGCSNSRSMPGSATGPQTPSCPTSSCRSRVTAFGDGNHASSSSAGEGSSGPDEATLDTLRSWQLRRQATEEEASRVELVLREEAQLRIITVGWLVGCLSWPQVTLLGTICWPYTTRPIVFAKAVQAQWQEQEVHKQQAPACE